MEWGTGSDGQYPAHVSTRRGFSSRKSSEALQEVLEGKPCLSRRSHMMPRLGALARSHPRVTNTPLLRFISSTTSFFFLSKTSTIHAALSTRRLRCESRAASDYLKLPIIKLAPSWCILLVLSVAFMTLIDDLLRIFLSLLFLYEKFPHTR